MIEKLFKTEIFDVLRGEYGANENTIQALKYGNVLTNIKGVQGVFDKVNKYEAFTFDMVQEACDLIMKK